MPNEIAERKNNGLHQIFRPTIWVVGRILLTIIFFVIFMPLGFLMRILNRDPLSRKLDPGAKSYYQPSKERTPNHMDKPY